MTCKNAIKRLIALLVLSAVLVVFTFSLFSCNSTNGKEKFTKTIFNYFDTVTNVVGYADNEDEFDSVIGVIEERLSYYHKLFDIYNSYDGITNICDVNNSGGKAVYVSREIIDLLEFSIEMHALTDGYVNIAMGNVLALWHEERIKYSEGLAPSVPSSETLSEAASHTDIDSIIIDKDNSTVTLSDPAVKLDLGAVAKGYAVELIAREIEAMGISGYAISAGGNVRAIGKKPSGEKWLIGIEDPTPSSDDPYVEKAYLESEALVTSGSYQRFYVYEGKSYHHIIDKDTLMPAVGYLSVSVIADSSALADALSTALFCMDVSEGKQMISELDGVYVMWVTDSGEILYSEGFSAFFDK